MVMTLAVGAVLKGQITRLQADCAFLRLGDGLVGTLRNPHVSWLNDRVSLDQQFQIGQVIDVAVLKVSRSATTGFVHVYLGHKETQPDPWERVEAAVSVGTRLRAVVVRDLLFGALVELPSGFRTLVHVSELSWTERKPKVSDFLRVGDTVEVVITLVEKEARRIQASYRQTQPDPWRDLAWAYPVGSITRGVVYSRMPYGLFVKLSNGCTGLLHNSCIPLGVPVACAG
jgi:small subunit ribosomal protein S1